MRMQNEAAFKRMMKEAMGRNLQLACDSLIFEMVTHELPSGLASPLATKIECRRTSPTNVQVIVSDPVWDYLSEGTGIYNPEHAGQGEGGAIVPTDPRVKALHFKDAKIAAALGFKGDDVYLKKVKGIRPRFLWDRYFRPARIKEKMRQVKREMKGIDIYSAYRK